LLRIGFDPDDPFSTEAKVIWSRDESDSEKKATFVHGLKFDMISQEQLHELKSILSRSDFHNPVVPGKASEEDELDAMMVDLTEDLDELGSTIVPDE
jgi:hypothetical protein